jgi:hypothetical protein
VSLAASLRLVWRVSLVLAATMVALSACDSDTTIRNQELKEQQTADTTCDAYRQTVGPMAIVLVSDTETAGQIVKVAAAIGEDPGVWATVPAHHVVAQCSYDPTGDADSAPTVRCPDGELYSTFEPTQFYVDTEGLATPKLGVPALPGSCP